MRRVAIIEGHPDPAGGHLCNALADAYATGAIEAGHGVTRIDIAKIDVPPLRNKAEYGHGAVSGAILPAIEAIGSSEHLVLVFPLWLGTMPAAVKAFLEQAMRPGVAFDYQERGFPKKRLAGRSAHLVVTMGMPGFAYRWIYGAHGIRGMERSIFHFVGIRPVRKSYLGRAEGADGARREGWLVRMREDGRRLR